MSYVVAFLFDKVTSIAPLQINHPIHVDNIFSAILIIERVILSANVLQVTKIISLTSSTYYIRVFRYIFD